jgi:hypothetical protein
MKKKIKNERLLHSYSTLTLYKNHINDRKILDNINKNIPILYPTIIKRNSSCQNFKINKFYKLFQKYKPKEKIKRTINVIDKDTFIFNKDEKEEILKKYSEIMKGNEKHRNLCEFARKKEIKKKKSIIKFKNRMKMMENNLKIIESKNLEEKKALLKLNKKNNSINKYKIYLKEQKRQIKLRKYINDNLVDNNNNFRFNRSKDKLNIKSDNLLKRINEKYNNILHATIHY